MTDVRVALLPIYGPQLAVGEDLLEVKRRGVFQNHVRHRLIAKFARQLVAGDVAAYDHLCPEIPDAYRTTSPKSVAVIVENVQHAAAIRQRLTGWAVWTGPRERWVNQDFHHAQSGFGISDTSRLVCTADGLPTAPLLNTDAWISLLARCGRAIPRRFASCCH